MLEVEALSGGTGEDVTVTMVETRLGNRIALFHFRCAGGHAAQVGAMGLGTVFFTHVIKASEPFIGTLVVLAFTGKIAPWYVNICLAPVVGGVAYAASKPGMGFNVSDLWSLLLSVLLSVL